MVFTFSTSVAKELKLNFRKFWELILTFVDFTKEKLVWGTHILNRVKLLEIAIVMERTTARSNALEFC